MYEGICVFKGRILVGWGGHVACLDANSGEMMWKNDLPRKRYNDNLNLF
jgi:outer membrane protein assembly factor BamB